MLLATWIGFGNQPDYEAHSDLQLKETVSEAIPSIRAPELGKKQPNSR